MMAEVHGWKGGLTDDSTEGEITCKARIQYVLALYEKYHATVNDKYCCIKRKVPYYGRI